MKINIDLNVNMTTVTIKERKNPLRHAVDYNCREVESSFI